MVDVYKVSCKLHHPTKVCCKGKGRQTAKRREKEVNTRALQLLDAMSAVQQGQTDGTLRGTIDGTLRTATYVNPTTVNRNWQWNEETYFYRTTHMQCHTDHMESVAKCQSTNSRHYHRNQIKITIVMVSFVPQYIVKMSMSQRPRHLTHSTTTWLSTVMNYTKKYHIPCQTVIIIGNNSFLDWQTVHTSLFRTSTMHHKQKRTMQRAITSGSSRSGRVKENRTLNRSYV